jgi:ABC-type branched-subunit amino acid transport system substrate-binding protein/predicted negative regulator of RcsB-dependent stress response
MSIRYASTTMSSRLIQLRCAGHALRLLVIIGALHFAGLTDARLSTLISGQVSPAYAEGNRPARAGSSQAVFDQAQRLIEAQQPEAAATMLRRFVASAPRTERLDRAYLLLGAALNGTKEYGEAAKFLNQLLTEFPDSNLVERAKLTLARTHAAQGNLDLALPALAELRSLSTDDEIKRDALELTGELHVLKKDYLRAIQAWIEEQRLVPQEQAQEVRNRIRDLVTKQLDAKTLPRVRDAYPKSFPGDLALIRLIELRIARGEAHLAERDIRQFLAQFPDHEYAARASELLASFKTKLKAYPHVIAAVLPLSGKLAPFANEVLDGILLAVEKARESMGLGSVGLIVKDSESDRGGFLSELSELLTDDHPLAVIGPLLSKNLPVMAEMGEKMKIPIITPAATFPNVRRLGSYVFSTALTYPLQAKRIADYATGEPGYRRFCILHPDTTYGRELARLFAQEIRQHESGEIIAIESYKEGDTDFGQQIKRLKAEDLKKYGTAITPDASAHAQQGNVKNATRILYTPGFDAVFLPGRSKEVGLIAAQLAFHDIKAPLLGANGWNSTDFARTADRTIEGGVFVDGFFVDSPNPNVQDFVERYQRRFQVPPSLFAAQAYDAAWLVLEAVRNGATSGEAVHNYLLMQYDLPTLTGPAGFTPDGTLNRRVHLIQVKHGRFMQID